MTPAPTVAAADIVSIEGAPAQRTGQSGFSCVLVVPDGMGLRNFLCTGFLDRFRPGDSVLIWHALPERAVAAHTRRHGPAVEWQRLPAVREGLGERVLRQSKVFGQLYWQGESGARFVLRNLRRADRPVNWIVSRAASALGYAFSRSPRGLARLDRWHARAAGGSARLQPFDDVLRRARPQVVFCTHQRASLAVPVMLAARRLGIPTATFVYSWDNLPKGRMAVHADNFLVWSDHMKDELLRYYPEVAADRVHVVGTPQFEPYFDPALIRPRDEFMRGLGLDPARRVVCFSGDDESTSPYDPAYLADLAQAIRSMDPARRPQLLFRRCPVDLSSRYEPVLNRYPEIAVSDPLWSGDERGDWTGVVPSVEDVSLLVNVVHHADLVVNVASTMAMDFAMVGKPALYLAYEPVTDDMAPAWRAADLYELPHFRTVHELEPVYWVRTRESLAGLVEHALARPADLAAARDAWVRRQVRLPLEAASERCHAALRRIALGPTRTCTSAS